MLVYLRIASTRTKKQPCAFVTENNKCCKLPFEFNNRKYTECTADSTEKDWDGQWRNPWCFPEDDSSIKHPCYRSSPSCGGVRTQVAGVFSSANFPNNYTNNTTCIWRISVELANHITLNFTDFDLENGSGCENAYVQVYDGLNTTDPSLGKFCGSEIPSGVRSSGSQMLVVFHGYNGDRYKGFRAYYDSGNCKVRSYGGNGGGACCVFPFTYKGKVYNKCTEEDDTTGLAWCSVTSDYGRDRKRGHCVSENVSCGSNKFECHNYHWWKQCIDEKLRCNGYSHCADQSDETDCPVEVPCNFSNWFKCSNGRCVPDYWRCDGKDDCGDRSDEQSGCSFQVQACSWVSHCPESRWEASLGNKTPYKIDSFVICNRKDLGAIPTYLPVKITKLVIKETRLTVIERFSFARYEHLEEIDLEGNVIEKIQANSFIKLQSLKTLILKRNKLRLLKTGTFEGSTSLTKLDLEENPLEKIEARAFHGLQRLQKLNLSNMDLRTISSEAFYGMDSLTELYLHHNKDLQQIPLDVFDSVPLTYLKADKFEFCCIAKLSGPNCSAPKDLFSSCDDLMANTTLYVCIWILGSIALVGNAFVLMWRMKTKSDNKVHSLLLLNLAIADFLMGIYLIIIAGVDVFYRGRYFIYNASWKRSALCQFSGFVSTISSEASVFILTIMTVDRYVTIVHPFRHIGLSVRGTYIALFITWSVAIVLAGVPVTGIEYFKEFYARSGVCLPLQLTANKPIGWEYSVFLFLALNFSSFMLIFVLYLVMFFKIQKTREMSGAGNAVTSIGTRMVFIVLTDFSCWIPIIIIGIASLLGMEASPTVYAWIAVFVLPLNSALNPILYTISTANFRRKLRGTIRKRSRKTGGYVTEHSLLDSKSANSGSTNGKSKLLNGHTQESDL
ncbi:G-protein coupled receptor GRL101 [Stylophora pistillata]|uniref:G-protein coupled receptor GRL101 n=1 Tax=Stylophora pistillata TaxID=50429 RepID=A0A2B4S4B0_STYPI|nr:G-protein coupled receptor GRL101 [Stylophora pistillata]